MAHLSHPPRLHRTEFALPPRPVRKRFSNPKPSPSPAEIIIPKQTNSAFIGTTLRSQLHAKPNKKSLVIAGVITNNSVEAIQLGWQGI